MEFFWGSLLIPIFSIFFFFFFTQKRFFQQIKNLPPGPLSLPIIGHLHLLKTPIHRTLKTLSDQYGPVLYLRFGSQPVVIVSSSSAAEQCFTHNDVAFANRSKSLAGKHLGYNHTTIAFSPYGDHWRDLRRITNLQIFSSTSLQLSSAVRNEEIRLMVGKLFRAYYGETQKVNLNSFFTDFVFNVMMKMVAGKGWSPADDIFGLSAVQNVCDYVPLLRWVGFKGLEKKLVKLGRKRDEFVQDLLNESRQNKITSCSTKRRKTIIEALLSLKEAEPECYTEDTIKGIIMTMFTAGTHTSVLTMEWAMSLLLDHPETLRKAQAEIDEHVQAGELVEDTDLPKLPYLHSIAKETLRLFPVVVAPIQLPHFSSKDCVIEGFHVPRGTMLFVNAWAIHRDPNLWEEPDKFKPERFVESRGEREGFKFLPFGVGRRQCPGDLMALRFVALALGALIQCFELERVGPELVDLAKGYGGSAKAKPLDALYKPRPSMTKVLSQLTI